MTKEEMIKNYMAKYDITKEEAIELIEDDETVDKMTVSQINKSYTKEEREAIKEATRVDSYAKKSDRKPREIKINPTKIDVINSIAELLENMGFDNVSITNAQKYITFAKGDEHYELNLVQKRAPKEKKA